MSKTRISALPIPPKSHILTHNLTPDASASSPSEFKNLLKTKPSLQRRARAASANAHFAYVSPLPLPFPYQVEPPENPTEEDQTEGAFIERWLTGYEPLEEETSSAAISGLKRWTSQRRNEFSYRLLGLSKSGLRDCVPHLDVGDAFEHLGSPSLTAANVQPPPDTTGQAERRELVDVLSGHSVLMNIGKGTSSPYAPYSLRYSGHQFGVWAGQLGDGRAISIIETPHPSDPEKTIELQLKGAGRTPFSRGADGLAVLRSSVREYLGAEAMHALGIPSTRSLAMIGYPTLPVHRETVETACVITRMATSFIRIGNFEALNPPSNVFFIGGRQQPADLDAVVRLGEWVVRRALRMSDLDRTPHSKWGEALVLESARRNAKMVAGWQVYGFMHGVINTDKSGVSISGLTIDYGPYAFMDIMDHLHICNHTDSEGRYAYHRQPEMVLYALNALVNALAPLLGAEAELGSSVKQGWGSGVQSEQLGSWHKLGSEQVGGKMKDIFWDTYTSEYQRLWRQRLGLSGEEKEDETKIMAPLLDALERCKLDFHSSLRILSSFSGSKDEIETCATKMLGDRCTDKESMLTLRIWLTTFAERIDRDSHAQTVSSEDRLKRMKSFNPRFVLRQWVLEEVIRKLTAEPDSGICVLAKVHEMATHPFESWGAEDSSISESELSAEVREERRYCGLGDASLLGFQCSCSS